MLTGVNIEKIGLNAFVMQPVTGFPQQLDSAAIHTRRHSQVGIHGLYSHPLTLPIAVNKSHGAINYHGRL